MGILQGCVHRQRHLSGGNHQSTRRRNKQTHVGSGGSRARSKPVACRPPRLRTPATPPRTRRIVCGSQPPEPGQSSVVAVMSEHRQTPAQIPRTRARTGLRRGVGTRRHPSRARRRAARLEPRYGLAAAGDLHRCHRRALLLLLRLLLLPDSPLTPLAHRELQPLSREGAARARRAGVRALRAGERRKAVGAVALSRCLVTGGGVVDGGEGTGRKRLGSVCAAGAGADHDAWRAGGAIGK
eukprot:COSAG01_NODE_8905_length_2620_cov_50.763189_2_plen_240_part_00